MENRKNDKKTIMYIGLLVACLTILSLIGTYAWYSLATSKNEEVGVEAANNLKLVYTDCNTSDVSTCADINKDLSPGESVEKVFEVTNTSGVELSFTLYFQELLNTFKSDDLVYKLENMTSNEVIISETPVPYAESKLYNQIIGTDIKVPGNATSRYKLTVTFLNRDRNQNENLNAKYFLKLSIMETKSFTLNFDANGGVVDISSKQVESGKAYGELPIPTRNDYAFDGWYTDASGGTLVENTSMADFTVQTLYAHWKLETFVSKLIAKANNASITVYNSGNEGEMFTFTHPEAEQTTGWSEEERKDYRYLGANPNNYIKFNDEIWRIIGVFTVENETGVKEQRIKIIRESSFGNLSWDYTNNENDWPDSTLYALLNGDYVNKEESFTYDPPLFSSFTIQGLSSIAKNQIASTKWYLGGFTTSQNLGGPDYYNFERGLTTCDTTGSCSGRRDTNIVAKVGLMYPSDYIYTYSNGVDTTCFQNGRNCNSEASLNSWLTNNYEWLISPFASDSFEVFYKISNIHYQGAFHDNGVFEPSHSSASFRPSVYLRSDIQTTGGDGSSENPYTLQS